MTTATHDPNAIRPLLRDLGQGPTQGRSLTRQEARHCLELILDGVATPAQAGGFLLLQRYKGETPEELLGFTDALRARARLIHPRVEGLLDVGSPYDGRGRDLVVSPAASIVAAACGLPVLMHGEKDMPPKHGLAVGDVLEALGVPTDLEPQAVERSIEQVGLGYLRQARFLPDLHAIKWLREEITLRSPLNMVEKIYDPAGAPYHLVGLTHLPYLEKLGGALAGMGFRRTLLVQGMEGNEDAPTARPCRLIWFEADGSAREERVNAADYGLEPCRGDALAIGEAQHTLAVLRGNAEPAHRDLVLFNAALRLLLCERVPNLATGIEMAREAIESGEAYRKLEAWRDAR